jgi:voltage-gated potassium channel
MYERIKRRTYEILEEPGSGAIGRLVQVFLIMIILANVAAIVAGTVNEYRDKYGFHFSLFEIFSVAIFSVEYLLRMWVAPLRPALEHSRSPRLRYIFTPMALIDLAAVLPFYLPIFLPLLTVPDLRFLRILRVMRLVRLLKLGRYSESMRMLVTVFNERKELLLASLMLVALAVVLSSGLLYYAEHDAQPNKFTDWPSSMWWAVCTLTTVGYGDMYPITPLGKFLSGTISILGIGLFALPAGILGSGFVEVHQRRRALPLCPHCGKPLGETASNSHNYTPPK